MEVYRTCVVTREKCLKKDLFRFVKVGSEVFLSESMLGRGAYIKKDIEVVKKARSKKIISRILKVEVSDSLYDKINL